ncbi:hypothetical protein ACFVZJ_15400 [Streptomyces sp. NPDC058322]|uniref:hypothetical protein n=1 Tax=unclassified Streptomyces TaxID=2593676 RepID=UPI003402750F
MHSELPPELGGAQLEHGWSVAGRVELFRAAESGPDGVRALVGRALDRTGIRRHPRLRAETVTFLAPRSVSRL